MGVLAPTIAVIDDDDRVLESLQNLFTSCGYKAETYSSAELFLTSGALSRASCISPLKRAERTCELADFATVAEVDRNLLEWNYGQYEGRRTAEIHAEGPDWQLFREGFPGGESPDQVWARADCLLTRVRAFRGDVLLFSSGHFLRAAHWLEFGPAAGSYLLLSTASLSALGYEHYLSQPAIRLWSDARHVNT